MKLRNNKTLKIAAATSGTVFSLVAVFVATFAWFSLNKTVGSNGMTVHANKNVVGRLGKVEIHKCLDIIGSGDAKTYSFKKDADTTLTYDWVNHTTSISGSTAPFELGDYTPLETDHPLLMVFVLNDEYESHVAGDIYIKGSSQKNGFLGEVNNGVPKYALGSSCPLWMGEKTILVFDDDGEPVYEDDGETQKTKDVDTYALSSAVNFKCDYFSSDDYKALEAKSTPSATTNDRINMIASTLTDANEAFVNFNTNATFKEFKKSPKIFSSPGKTNNNPTPIQYITMVVNYDQNAISAIYSTYLGDTTLEGPYEERLYFSCDWSLEVY